MIVNIKDKGFTLNIDSSKVSATSEATTNFLHLALNYLNTPNGFSTEELASSFQALIKDAGGNRSVEVPDDMADITASFDESPLHPVKDYPYLFHRATFSNLYIEENCPVYLNSIYAEKPIEGEKLWDISMVSSYVIFTQYADKQNGYTIPVRIHKALNPAPTESLTYYLLENEQGDTFCLEDVEFHEVVFPRALS